MKSEAAPALESLLETLHGYEDTFVESPTDTVGRLSPSDAIAKAIAHLRQGRSVKDVLVFGGLLGEGGMGKVRLAEQRSIGRDVAVKGLREVADEDSLEAHTLLSEGWVMGVLEHPNIPPVYDLMLDDSGSPLVLLKRIEGDEWFGLMLDEDAVQKRFGQSLLSWNLSVLDTVCNAISYAHSKGIVHRDLKPQNVMIGEFGEVYVLDWGIAVSLLRDPKGKIPFIGDSNQPAGTPCYMAPELLVNETAGVDERTDVYLVGAILYECITGKPPHMEITMRAMVESIKRSEPGFSDDVPLSLQAICKKAMAADLDDRYQNIEAFQLALRDYQQRSASSALSDEAADRLRQLRVLAEDDTGDNQSEMSALFSECRFAYRQAIDAYPDEAAVRGLSEATELMAWRALDQDRSDAAAAFVAELSTPSDALVQALAKTQANTADRSKRLAHLERQQDSEVDQGGRSLLVILFCLAVTLPLVGHALADTPYYTYPAALAWQVFLCIGFMWVYPRFRLEATEQNRLTYIAIATALVAEILATLGAYAAGLPLNTALLFDAGCWTACAIMVVFAMGWIYLPIAAGYFGAMLVMALFPEYTHYAIAVANCVMLICAGTVYAMKIKPAPLVRLQDDHKAQKREL